FFMNRSVKERVLLLDEIANNWVQSGIRGRQILDRLKKAGQDWPTESDGDAKPVPVTTRTDTPQGIHTTPGLNAPEGMLTSNSQRKRKATDLHEYRDLKGIRSKAIINATAAATSTPVDVKNVNRTGPITQDLDGNSDDGLAVNEVEFVELKAIFSAGSDHKSDEDDMDDRNKVVTGKQQGPDNNDRKPNPTKKARWKKWSFTKRKMPSGRVVWENEEWCTFEEISAGISIITGRKLVNGEGTIDRVFNNLLYSIKYCLYIELGLNFAKALDPLVRDSRSIGTENLLEFVYKTLRQQVGSLVKDTQARHT
ncbi:hypothetical protein BGZ82_003885, partial [Podila clonocystis]